MPSLSLPDSKLAAHASIRRALRSSAAVHSNAFCVRGSDFQVTHENASTVASICSSTGRHSAGYRAGGSASALPFD